MGFRSSFLNDNGQKVGGYARVWSVEDKGKYASAQISTSKKNKDTGTYETDFQKNFVSFVGHAYNKIKGVQIPERKGVPIQIHSCDVTNRWDANKKVEYINFVVFDFDFTDTVTTSNTTNNTKVSDGFMDIPDGIDEELPFA